MRTHFAPRFFGPPGAARAEKRCRICVLHDYRDDGFEGSVAKLFGVKAIPHTFTIDSDGVLQDEHIGDASVEGKMKKLRARARDLPSNAGPQNNFDFRLQKAAPEVGCTDARECRAP